MAISGRVEPDAGLMAPTAGVVAQAGETKKR